MRGRAIARRGFVVPVLAIGLLFVVTACARPAAQVRSAVAPTAVAGSTALAPGSGVEALIKPSPVIGGSRSPAVASTPPPGDGATPGAESVGRPDPDRDLSKLAPAAAADFEFRAGTAAGRRRFAGLTTSLEGVSAQVKYYRVLDRSSLLADIAVYSFDPQQTRSVRFRGQIVNQMVGAAAKSKKVRTETVSGRSFAVSGSAAVAVGSFDDNTAVIALGRSGHNSLTLARTAVYAYLDR